MSETTLRLKTQPCRGKMGRLLFVLSGAAILLAVCSQAMAQPLCIGDCGGDSEVSVDELIRMVNIALGTSGLDVCRSGDRDENGVITIDEIVAGVRGALEGCVTVEVSAMRTAIENALQGVDDPWGTGFGTVVARTFAALGLPVPSDEVFALRAASASLEDSCEDPFRQYCPEANYCGAPSNSRTAPPSRVPSAVYIPVSTCFNRACWRHDIESFQACICGAKDACGAPTGEPDCFFSNQSIVPDGPFFRALFSETDACQEVVVTDRFLKLFVEALLLRRTDDICRTSPPAECCQQSPPCDVSPSPTPTRPQPSPTPTLPPLSTCGNDRLDPGEQCDFNADNIALGACAANEWCGHCCTCLNLNYNDNCSTNSNSNMNANLSR